MPGVHDPKWIAVARAGTSEAARASVVVLEGAPGAGTLIAFAGMRHGFIGGLADDAFTSSDPGRREFSSVLAAFEISVLLVKDAHDAWYQSGLAGIAPNPEEAANALVDMIPAGSALLGTLGASSGGTAAVLYGALMRAPRVLAFSPRTVITEAAVAARAAKRLPGWADKVDLKRDTADLQRFLSAARRTDIEIHVGDANAHDVRHASRIAGFDGVRVVRHPTESHMCARWLKEQDLLDGIIETRFGLTRLPGDA